MSNEGLRVEISADGVGRITLDRGEVHNAFDDRLIALLTEAFASLDAAPEVRLILLAASGKSFSAGADLNWMKRMAGYDWQQNYADSCKLAALMQQIYSCKKTTLALCQGAAFGGGVGLLACCDIVLASEKSIFCLSEVKLGLIPAVISPYVVKAMGERAAKRYFVTAERFGAAEAKANHLVHEVFPGEEFNASCDAFIKQILTNGPAAMMAAKALVNEVASRPIDENLQQYTAKRIADIRASVEGKEGIAAFLEKRPPRWPGQA